jgi:hypothetical protein
MLILEALAGLAIQAVVYIGLPLLILWVGIRVVRNAWNKHIY